MSTPSLIESYGRSVIPTYARFPIALERGQGCRVWDSEGREHLDFATGIAVNSLGHCHPAVVEAIGRQAQTLIHTSNLYHTFPQAALAEKIVHHVGDGKCFFCNSGAEANEALFKLARKFGHDQGRYEILTAAQSFHGRTLAGISATGQDKVKKGFEPMVDGFRHIPFNDLDAAYRGVGPRTVAILIEGVQGESGIWPATPDYLLGLRQICNEKNLLLLVDAVQCGMFRTGRFQSFQRILEGVAGGESFLPDAISMAKGLGGGIPIGAIWAERRNAGILGPGTHGSTFGGTPLACSAALAVFDVVEKENLAANARLQGEWLKEQIRGLNSPHVAQVRGLGLLIGIELKPEIQALKSEGRTAAALFVERLHGHQLLTVPAGAQTVRLLPPLNVTRAECQEAVDKLAAALTEL